jgi:alkanesulfonate monooxygenase SsuD/methylene tetrahydromethanopterin reductase-like flavin-dependent oxidoreductase (luciferase family)
VFLPFYAFHEKEPAQKFEQLKNVVLECERLGYDSVWLDDHLMFNDWAILEPWTVLSSLATQTSTIRLGTLVTCNAHHNPALLAKTAATLDVVSNGRLEFGIGAGCQEKEHLAYGFGFPSPSVRVEQLGEALEVLIRLWTQKKASYTGKHFALKDAVCEPKPLQKPHPPITVGGSGDKLLRVTAKYADRFDFGSLPTVEDFKQKLKTLQEYCEAVSRNFNAVEKSCWPAGQILVASNQKEKDRLISQYKPAETPLEEFRKGTLAGMPDECVKQLQVYRDLGVSYFMLYFADLPKTDSLRLFSKNVAKLLA